MEITPEVIRATRTVQKWMVNNSYTSAIIGVRGITMAEGSWRYDFTPTQKERWEVCSGCPATMPLELTRLDAEYAARDAGWQIAGYYHDGCYTKVTLCPDCFAKHRSLKAQNDTLKRLGLNRTIEVV